MSTATALQKLANAKATRDEVKAKYDSKIREIEEEVQLMEDETNQYQKKLKSLEMELAKIKANRISNT